MILHRPVLRPGETRIRRKFALWPVRIDEDTVIWWHYYWIREQTKTGFGSDYVYGYTSDLTISKEEALEWGKQLANAPR